MPTSNSLPNNPPPNADAETGADVVATDCLLRPPKAGAAAEVDVGSKPMPATKPVTSQHLRA
jgi:hypothetical protein